MSFWAKWALGLVLALLACLVAFFPGGESKETTKAYACLSNLKQQGLALTMYAEKSDGRFTPHSRWMDASASYRRNRDDPYALRCNKAPQGAYGYAFNADLSGAVAPKRSEAVPLVYESTRLGRNESDRFESFPSPGRHEGRGNVVYADGHGKRVPVEAP